MICPNVFLPKGMNSLKSNYSIYIKQLYIYIWTLLRLISSNLQNYIETFISSILLYYLLIIEYNITPYCYYS